LTLEISNEITHMTTVTASMLLILFLPFLLSLAGKAGTPKVLCLVTSVMALLLSVEPYRAGLPWIAGMAIAIVSIRERIEQRRASQNTSFRGSPNGSALLRRPMTSSGLNPEYRDDQATRFRVRAGARPGMTETKKRGSRRVPTFVSRWSRR